MRPIRAPVLLALSLLLLAVPLNVPSTYAQVEEDLRVQAMWTEGGRMENGLPERDVGYHLRVLLEVQVPDALHGVLDLPITYSLDLSEPLRSWGYPTRPDGHLQAFELDPNSMVLVEVDPDTLAPVSLGPDGRAVHTPTSIFSGSFFSADPFDARFRPVATLQWVLDGATEGDRFFFLYFDSIQNGDKDATALSPEEAGKIAASVGPGRGTRVYVPLHNRISGLPSDPRTVRITNLQDREVLLDVYEYRRGLPEPQPVLQDLSLPAGIGNTVLHLFRSEYEGSAILLDADGLITAEATTSWTRTNYPAGSTTLFIPSADGGFVGTRFVETPGVAANWYLYCSSVNLPSSAGGCEATVGAPGSPGNSVTIPRDGYVPVSVGAGQPTEVAASVGAIAVQRVSTQGDPQARPLSPWPPLDGPTTASTFMGHALGEEGASVRDLILLSSVTDDAHIAVTDLAGSRQVLSGGYPLQQGLWTEGEGNAGFGTRWQRNWEQVTGDRSTARDHEDGPIVLAEKSGTGGLTLINGRMENPNNFGALAPLQSPDGGLTYHFAVPSDRNGVTLGQLVAFTPYPATTIQASGTGLDGTGPARNERWESLQKDQYLRDEFRNLGPGWWTLTADRPILAAWIKEGSEPFAAFAPAVTQAAQVEPVFAQFSGHLFQVTPREPFKTVEPGTTVTFDVDITNLGRRTDGQGVPDRLHVAAQVPPGWPSSVPIPSTFDIQAGQTRTVSIPVEVPQDAAKEGAGGATVSIQVQSRKEPRLQVDANLRLNYHLARGVSVSVDDSSTKVTEAVKEGEHALYEVEVTNTGSVPDTFDIVHSVATDDWTLEVTCSPDQEAPCLDDGMGRTDELEAGETASYFFRISPVPGGNPFRLVTHVLATSRSDPSVFDSAQMQTLIETERSFRIEVLDPVRVIDPGSTTTFNITVVNEAEFDELLVIDLQSVLPRDWPRPDVQLHVPDANEPVRDPESFPVLGLSSVRIEIRQEVPGSALPLDVSLHRLGLHSPLSSSELAHTVELRVLADRLAGADVAMEPGIVATTPGGSTSMGLSMTSTGNHNQTLHVVPRLPTEGTGWRIVDPDGTEGPWDVKLPTAKTVLMPLFVHVPRDAPPVGSEPLVIQFEIQARDMKTQILEVEFRVSEHLDLEVEQTRFSVAPGRTTPVHVPITNAGNVPATVCASVEDMPPRWSVNATHVKIPVAATEYVVIPVHAPAETGTLATGSLVLRKEASCADAGGRVVERSPLEFTLGSPEVAATLEPLVLDAGDGRRIYRIKLQNTGDAAAYDVRIRLERGGQVEDQVVIEQILPGTSPVVSLVGPAQREGLSVLIRSSHDPEGLLLGGDAFEALDASPSDDQILPAPAIPLVGAAVLAGLAVSRRRRREDA